MGRCAIFHGQSVGKQRGFGPLNARRPFRAPTLPLWMLIRTDQRPFLFRDRKWPTISGFEYHQRSPENYSNFHGKIQ